MNEKDPPIQEMDFVGGVKVVSIGDLRVARGLSRRPHSACQHMRLTYDGSERRIWCQDCERDVEPFDAFRGLVEWFSAAESSLAKRNAKLVEAEQASLKTRASREIDKAWSKRKMVPACPSCSNGLFPEDFADGVKTMLGRDYAAARRTKSREARSANVEVREVDG